ncbi:hypothetical protein CAEBREN_16575 [Caenorhabditis brenneri]|uniref:DUF7153 domain-containing protein n=1 Tax=Caenorhabditis brenneri TaxID=135651 RepID=G0PJJ9_CAEBE|nr:hypothetical protein CAEBREN_16575 [Caenorhabditis brenneri]
MSRRRFQKSEEVIDVSEGEMSEVSSLIGFVGGPREPGCSYGFAQEDPAYEKAVSECHLIQEKRDFAEAVLLKCIDNKRCYDEVYSIQKTASVGENRLPAHRHSGYIVIGFKILEESGKGTLEKTWLQWSGAREIYKHSPRSWNLRRISLMRCPTISHKNGVAQRPFAYILMCEYGSILHPSNTIQALDICERLRVRNCGHIALYQRWVKEELVHSAYTSPGPRTSAHNSPSRQAAAFAQSAAAKRSQMLRGFSQDVEPQPVPETSTMRRNRMLRTRERSFQYPEEHYHAYQPYQFDPQEQY